MEESKIDGYWYYDGSTIFIKFGQIMGGDGSHYENCRYRGEFKDGKATITCGGVGSKCNKKYSQEWVYSDNSIIVDGGSYVWSR